MFTKLNNMIKAGAQPGMSERSGLIRSTDEKLHELSTETEVKKENLLQQEQETIHHFKMENHIQPKGFVNKDYGISEFLSRQYDLATYTWSTTDTSMTELGRIILPQELHAKDGFAEKFANFNYLHGKMEIEVRVNPTPFLAGSLLIVVGPMTGFDSTNYHEATYYPHGVINLSVNNTVTIDLPFLSPFEAYSIDSQRWFVFPIVLTPLTSTTSPDSIEVNIFGKYTNPRLMMPVAQSGENEQEEINKTGTVTKVTGAIADTLEIAGTALSQIPLVGAFVPPLTWVARASNKVAAYYGWSKPINVGTVRIIAPMPGPRMCHAEGEDNSVALTLAPDNAVNTYDNGFTKLDEMSMSYIMERKYVSRVLSMSGDSIEHVYLSYSGSNYGSTSQTVLNMFKYKRYTACYEIHFIKTRFHVGRLLVQLDLNEVIDTVDTAKANLNTTYSKMVDISKQDRVVFTVPWTSNSPFLTDRTGRLAISTFNDLKSPDSVQSGIQLVVYRSYRDVQVGFPIGNAIAQMECCGNEGPIPTDTTIPYVPQSMVEHCMGESVTNLRALAKRFTFSDDIIMSSAGPTIINSLTTTSLFSTINSLYAYRNGGLRYKFLLPHNATLIVSIYNDQGTVGSGATQIFNSRMNNVAEITLPYYYNLARASVDYPWPEITMQLYDNDMNARDGGIKVYVAAADDYNGVFLKGVDKQIS